MAADASFPELIKRVRRGDPEAAAELVRRYEPEVRRVVRLKLTDRRLRRTVDSLDICQSVLGTFFVKVMAGLYDLDDPSQLVRLLVTMARNRVIDHARGAAHRRTQEVESGLWRLFAARDQTPAQLAARDELLRRARHLVSEDERMLIESRVAGRGWQELAAEYGQSPDALRKRYVRILDRLCQSLGADVVQP